MKCKLFLNLKWVKCEVEESNLFIQQGKMEKIYSKFLQAYCMQLITRLPMQIFTVCIFREYIPLEYFLAAI